MLIQQHNNANQADAKDLAADFVVMQIGIQGGKAKCL